MKSTLILITHVQANPSPYGGPTEMGGNAIRFQASTRITCLSSTETPKDGEKTGRESKFKIYKSSLGPGTGEGVFYIKYGHGYDKELDIFKMAEELGLICKSGAS
jgi:RecA/RadA recombinase